MPFFYGSVKLLYDWGFYFDKGDRLSSSLGVIADDFYDSGLFWLFRVFSKIISSSSDKIFN